MNPATPELISRKLPARSSGWRCLVGCAVASWILGSALGAEVDITPTSAADGAYASVTVGGQTAWQNTGTSRYLYGRRPNSFAFTVGQTLYVRVTYFDDAVGTVDLQFDAQTSNNKSSTLTTRTSRVNTGRFVDGFFELPDVLFNKRLNGSDFRIVCGTAPGAMVPVQRITLSDTPFTNPDFQLAVSRAWQTRYTGPAKDYVDATTLKGKVMTGYQGWFGTPNDIADTGGWKHWARSGGMIPENFTIDAWPGLTEYDPATLVRAANVMTGNGAPAYLFSSRSYPAVQKHFRWMRKHNIDGAWLQRFHPQAGAESEWVLRNVSQAAAEEGLIWGVEYDVSGMADSTVAAKLQADWEWLTTQFDLLNDPRYARENGKPVVFIWGLAVPDRAFTTASANAAVDYFKAQGAYVIGGLPTNWNTLNADWKVHMAKYDGVLVWQNTTTSDAAFFRNRGQDFFPHVWPGFSWANLKQLPATPLTQYTDRAGGQFHWNKGRDWINGGGADRLFIGMFDEYDESTQVMPMTDDPPDPSAAYGRFIDNQGKPSDWWMMLTDELKRMMLDQRADTGTLPAVASLSNRSNIGAEASVDLGTTDSATSLARITQADGNTTVETVGGKLCRGNTTLATDRYMYFDVANAFAYQLVNGDVTVEVEYYDSFYGTAGGTTLGLQYDSASANYANHSQSIVTTGSNTWRTVRFEIADAYFGGRQNGAADFRLSFNGKKLNVNRVWVRLPEGKAYPFTWTNATAGPALDWSQNANWLGGIVGQSDLTSIVKILPGQTMPGGTIPITNNLTGQQFGTLQLGGTASSSADTTVTLSGNSFSLGGTAPTITLDAMKTAFDLTHDIMAPVTLLGMTQITGTGNATFRISGVLSGSGGLSKTNNGTLTLAGANSYTGTTTVGAGTLAITNTTSLTGGLSFGATAGSTTASALDLSNGNSTYGGAFTVQTNTTANNTITIGAGRTLATNGDVTIGTNTGVGTATNLTVTGNGSWNITNSVASGSFQMGAATGATNTSATAVDLSSLGIFDANLSGPSSVFRLGDQSSASGTVASTLKLAPTSTITATTLGVGDNSSPGGLHVLSLGTGVNTIRANTINIGQVAGNRSSGEITFQHAVNGTLSIRSQSGAAATANLTLVNTANSSGNVYTSKLMMAGHNADVSLNSLVMAARSNGNNAGANTTAEITFDNGTFTALTTAMAARTGSALFGTNTGMITIGGGTASLGAVTMAGNTNTNATTGVATATLTITNGNVTASSINMANAVSTGIAKTANGNINLSGGSLTLTTGNITRTGGTGTENAIITLDGGTLNMNGRNIGTSTAAISLVAQSGALQNIAAINGSGGLTKTTAGTLVLSGTNTSTGATTISEGTLVLGASNVLPDSSGVSIAAATLNDATAGIEDAGTLAVTAAATINLATGAQIEFDASDSIPWSGTLNLTGTFVPGLSIRFGNSTGLTSIQLGKISATGVSGFVLDGSGYLTTIPAGFSSWITGTFTNGQVPTNQRGPNDDFDNDGICNLIEYAIAGQDPTVPNPTVGTFTGNSLSFDKRAGTGGLTYAIQRSTDLGLTDAWIEVTGGSYVNGTGTISYAFTPGTPAKSFLRLKVVD